MPMSEDIYEAQCENIANDVLDIRSTAPKLTAQEQMFVAALVAGASVTEASRRCGVTFSCGNKWKDLPHIQAAREHYTQEFAQDVLPRIRFTREDAHHMYMTAYRNSANATEQVKATDALVKLHRLAEPERAEEGRDIRSFKQLENLSRAQLLKLADMGLDSLIPEGVILEGEIDDTDG